MTDVQSIALDQAGLADLSEELIQEILAHVGLEDLVFFSRTCKRFCSVVQAADSVWRGLYSSCFGSTEGVNTTKRPWKAVFRERLQEEQQRTRLERAARRMKLQSQVQVLSVEVHRTRQQLRSARQRADAQQAELANLERIRQAGVSVKCWQPVAIANHLQQLVAQQPIESEWHERSLREAVRDARLHAQGLAKSLTVREAQLASLKRRLHRMQGA